MAQNPHKKPLNYSIQSKFSAVNSSEHILVERWYFTLEILENLFRSTHILVPLVNSLLCLQFKGHLLTLVAFLSDLQLVTYFSFTKNQESA